MSMSSQLNASLLRLKLLDALRSGDTSKVDAVNSTLQSTQHTIQTTDIIQLKETILHYAVQVAPLSMIQYLINNNEKYGVDINSQDADGNTPLHLAAFTSRGEVVKYLLSLPNINDTIVNLEKKQPVEMCKDLELVQLMQFERAKFVEKVAGQLREYFTTRNFDQLEELLVLNQRAAELLDINGSDPETGNTVLHEFIAKNDLQMCEWILGHGGDPFKRDKRGKLPIDLIQNKSDPIRKMLKAASKDQTMMDPVQTANSSKLGNAPTYKGYLKKWTNFASGYKLRYFVLDEKGILSYYTNQDDTNNACRGSLNLGFAFLHLDSSEKLKFEIIGKNGIRWHLKANHPIETNRWVWNLQNAITISKDNLKKSRKVSSGNASAAVSGPGAPGSAGAVNEELKTPVNVNRPSIDEPEQKKHHMLSLKRKHKRTGSSVSLNSQGSVDESSVPPSRASTFVKAETPNLLQINEHSTLNSANSANGDQYSYLETDNENFDYDSDDLDDEDDDEDEDPEGPVAKNNKKRLQDEISTVRGSLEVEIRSVLELFNSILQSPDTMNIEIFEVGRNTLSVIQELFAKYNTLISNYNAKHGKKLERQLEINKLWENSIRQLEREIVNREQKLAEYEGKKKQLKKLLTAKSGTLTPQGTVSSGKADTLPEDPAKDPLSKADSVNVALEGTAPHDSVLDEILNDSDDEFFDADDLIGESLKSTENLAATSSRAEVAPPAAHEKTAVAAAVAPEEPTDEGSSVVPTDSATTVTSDTEAPKDEKAEETTDTTDELNEAQAARKELIIGEKSFLGYENPPRTRLRLDEDDRPKVSLWGILKNLIGKDMTRMTLPVSFNECTSLLQRLAEDIEYSTLLDQAATFDDSALRCAYVAAFAASEYASTINRIAKPFNPLLGETFEYCRPDRSYRLVSEQVSHHPPISACKAESIKWDYYGENAVDSKLRVRSFDFKHLGKMFCVVRPDNGVINTKGEKVYEELYSWKKVNTSVVGIIVGNPTVDNFGLMEVVNHTTGDKIVVDMKQRGWKATSAYQLSGSVVDKDGTAKWAIGGHWNSNIFGKRLSTGKESESANRRASLVEKSESSNTISKDPYSGGAFLIWQAAPRPKVPFNLTSFAITLNGIDDNLKEYLPPTDTRLRPDQRAMEDGEYDKAADEKHRVEEKQRAARKKRELQNLTYKPNWFVKRKHPVTGDAFWEFKGDYWVKRSQKQLADSGDIF